MFLISLLKLGFTLKEIDLSLFSSLQRYFLHLPDFLLFSRASAPAKLAQRSPIRKRKLKPIDPKKKSKAKLIIKSLYCVFIRVFRLNIPAANLQHTGSSPAVFAVNFFFKPVDARKFGLKSAYSVYPYRPQGRGKKKLNRVGKGAPDIAFRFGAKKTKQKQNRTFRGSQQSCLFRAPHTGYLSTPQAFMGFIIIVLI